MTTTTPSARPAQEPRQGPRPAAVHLMAAMGRWTSAVMALPAARAGLVPWRADLAGDAAALNAALEAADPDALIAALGADLSARFESLIAGIAAYRSHPYRRTLDEPVGSVPRRLGLHEPVRSDSPHRKCARGWSYPGGLVPRPPQRP